MTTMIALVIEGHARSNWRTSSVSMRPLDALSDL
jgi:hypothetical protein